MSDFRDMYEKISIVEVAKHYGAEFVNSTLAHCCCHRDRTPSMSFYIDREGTERFKCHATGNHGNVISLVMLMENYNFGEAHIFLKENFL